MTKSILITLALTTFSSAHAACLPDSQELGDIGPSSEVVCETLASVSPQGDIRILDREINSPRLVTVKATIGDSTVNLNYSLKGYQWKLNTDSEMALADMPLKEK